MPVSIKDIEAEIVEEFSWFEDPLDRYEHIIEMGKNLAPLADEYKTEANVVKGCQSTVWLHAYEADGLVHYQADSNTVITKGIIALLVRVFSGQPMKVVLSSELDFIEKINLRAHLSSQRSNGLSAMIEQMKRYALAFLNQQEKQKV